MSRMVVSSSISVAYAFASVRSLLALAKPDGMNITRSTWLSDTSWRAIAFEIQPRSIALPAPVPPAHEAMTTMRNLEVSTCRPRRW